MKITTDQGKFRVGCHHLRYFRKDAYPNWDDKLFSTVYDSFEKAGRALEDMEKLVEREQPNDVYHFFIKDMDNQNTIKREQMIGLEIKQGTLPVLEEFRNVPTCKESLQKAMPTHKYMELMEEGVINVR